MVIGALDLDFLDFDLDFDADVSTETGGIVFFAPILHFFNIGAMPFMIYLSLLILVMWNFSILANYYIPNRALPLGLLLLMPNVVVSLFVTKMLTAPLLPFFKSMNVRH